MTSRLLERYGGRPFLVALAAMNAIIAIPAAIILAPLSYGSDALYWRRWAEAVARGELTFDFVYPPLFGMVARPLTWMSPAEAAVLMTCLGLAALLVGVAVETRGLPRIDRVLIGVAILGFLPVVNELILGQVTLFLALALLPVRRRDGFALGVPLGVAVALMPKPLMIPVLLWMLVYRRKALGAVVLIGVGSFVAGVALLGTDVYADWVGALVHTAQVTRNGNLSLWATGFGPWPAGLAALTVAAMAATILRDEKAGFVAALLAGLLLAPYSLLYAASILLVGARPALERSPVGTRILALAANPLMLAAFAFWCVASLCSTLAATARRSGGRTGSLTSEGAPPAEP